MPLTITPNLTNVYLDQADTSFTRTHTVAQAAIITDTDFFRQGSSSVAWQTKATGADQGLAFDSGASNINLSNTILRVWGQFNEANKYDTKANGGVRVFVSDGAFGADNWGEWYVDGSDTLTADWRNYVIDTTTPFDRTSATAPTMTTIRRIGFSTNMITKPAKVQNVHIDAIRYGRGLTVTGTVSETGKGWQEIVTADENISNQYGVLQRTPSGVLVLTGEIIIGDATGSLTTNFSDIQNEKIVVPIAFTGNLEGLVNIIVRGNATGTTDFRLGSVVGTGDDRQGILGGIIFTNGDQFGFDSETDTADIDTCYLYGVTFEGARNVKLSGSTTQKAIGCTFNGCGEVQPNNAEFLNNTIIGPSPNLGIEMINGHQIKQVSCVAGSTDDQPVAKAVQFDVSATPVHSTVDYTTQINNSTANNVVPFPAADAIGDYFAFGFPAKFNTLKINTGTARSGGSLNWRYWNGSSWTTFTPTTDNTNTLSTTGLQTVTLWATPPAAWQPTTLIPDSGFRREKKQMFYISTSITGLLGTNPLITQAFIADVVEHHLHLPSTTGSPFDSDALQFFGHSPDGQPKWHAINDSGGSITINAINGSNLSQGEVEDIGASQTTVVAGAVTVKVTAIDVSGSGIANASVHLRAANGTGPFPYQESVTISRTGTLATVTHTAHGMLTNDKILLRGITDKKEDNTVHQITVTGTNTYTYTTTDSGSTSYTGTITSTFVALNGIADGLGVLSTSRVYPSSQPVTGWTRKSTSPPFFQQGILTGSINNITGYDVFSVMISDE